MVKTHAILVYVHSKKKPKKTHIHLWAQLHSCVIIHLSTPYVGVNELVLNSFTSWQELHSKPWKQQLKQREEVMWEHFPSTPLWIYLKPADSLTRASRLWPHPDERQEKRADLALQLFIHGHQFS